MRALDALRRLLDAPAPGSPPSPAPPAPPQESEHEGELRRLRARNEVLVDFVQRIERQRDDWRHRFYEQSAQHLTGQTMLEDHVLRVGTVLVAALKLLNEERTKAGKPEVGVKGLHALASQGGTVLTSSTAYRQALEQLASRAVERDEAGSIVGMSEAPREADDTSAEALLRARLASE